MPRIDPPIITPRRFFDRVTHFPGIIELGEHEPNWYRFAHGYKLAADELVAQLNERGAGEAFVCFPILFLYRHSVELYLKALLLDLGQLLDEDEAIDGRHGLRPLWTSFRQGLLTYDPSQGSPWLDRAGELIDELDTLDRRSFSFRYPVAKDGSSLLEPGQGVHLQHFADVMKELYVVLEGAAALFGQHLDLNGEAEEYNYYCTMASDRAASCLTRACSRQAGAGRGSRRARVSSRPSSGSIDLCRRQHDRLQLMRMSLGRFMET